VVAAVVAAAAAARPVALCAVARVARRVALCALALAGVAIVLSGCGDGSVVRGHHRITAGRLLVYSSLPTVGPSAATGRAVLEGERMALAVVHGRVGRYTITLRALDDATVASDGADPGRTSANAGRAAADPRTIGYIGELDSGATAISLPLLNHAEIPQISPLSTALGLTRGGPGASPGEPQKYYPSDVRTFARVVPNDGVQSAVQVALQRADGCRRVYVFYDDEVEGRDAADSYEVAARRAGLDVLGFDQFQADARGTVSLPARLRALAPQCVLVSALIQNGAAAITDAVARALPRARLFVTSPLAEPAFVDPALGGVDLTVDPRLVITDPTLSAADYPPLGRRFQARFRRMYGSGAGEGIWGDAAMSLMLHAIRRASDSGRQDVTRTRVLRAIFATRRLPSVLGTYSIQASGDTTLCRFGVYRVRDGRLVFWKAMRG
jgi:branched-chain amino acid transport system substrate-binding protein